MLDVFGFMFGMLGELRDVMGKAEGLDSKCMHDGYSNI